MAAASFLLACAAFPVHAMTVELGAVGGGGLALVYGSFLDSKAAALGELGAASLTTVGSSQAQLFPGWAGGAYAQTDLLSWLALRVELTYESAGAERLALTSAGAPFDQYGVSFSSFTVPVLLRAGITWGPGQLFASTGPFLGIVAGTITIVDRYASSATTAVITPDLAHLFYFGLEGSVGYAFPFGPGRVGIELRSDWSLTPVAVGPGPADGVNPLSVNVVLSYGFRLGTATQ